MQNTNKTKYHGSCYKMFLRVLSKSNKTFADEDFNDIGGSGLDYVYDSVYEFCEKLTKSSRIVEFKEIRKLMQDKANQQGIEIPQSDYNNLIRKLSNKFKELRFVHQEHNKALVFAAALKIEDLVAEYYSLKCELDSLNKIQSDDGKAVESVAKKINTEIKSLMSPVSWPPKE